MGNANQAKEIYQMIVELTDSCRSFALVTILKADGSTPQKVGTKAIIDDSGKIFGTIGGGRVEAEARNRAIEACKLKQPLVFDFQMNGAVVDADEPLCGGGMRLLVDTTTANNRAAYAQTAQALKQRRKGVLVTTILHPFKPTITVRWFSQSDISYGMENAEAIGLCLKRETPLLLADKSNKEEISKEEFIEPIIPRPHLLIAGGGHIGRALAHQVARLGFEITIIDDRQEFTDKALFPEGVATLCGDISKHLADFRIEADTYIVIATRGHKMDAEALEACIHSDAAYIGMIGSKRKVAMMRESFISSGIATDCQFNRVSAPVGLDIGAVTVEEIATSIAAQLIAVRRKGKAFTDAKDMTLS